MTAGIKSPPILTFHNPLNLVNSAFLGNHQPHTTMRQNSLWTHICIFMCLKLHEIFSEPLVHSAIKVLVQTLCTPTVTESADLGFIPLLWRPQGPQGCLEQQNHPLSSNLVIWCAKMGPKTKEVQKTSELTTKTCQKWWFFEVSWFWAQF